MTEGFAGVVLTGGSSRRMGRDKALITVSGSQPLAGLVRDALVFSGASDVFSVGGDAKALATLGVRSVPDRFPGEGPLGGIITALEQSASNLVVVLACDTPDITADVPGALVREITAHPSADVAVVTIDGRRHPLNAVWRRDRCLAVLEDLFAQGERAPRMALSALNVHDVTDIDPGLVDDVDSPEDLDRYSQATDCSH
jgi:molybdopterin-guanine dinucleotide biosynthesis protein A